MLENPGVQKIIRDKGLTDPLPARAVQLIGEEGGVMGRQI